MHVPVLLKEILEAFDPKPGEYFIDCTVGGGGHAIPLAERVGSKGKILAIDWDAESLTALEEKIRKERPDILPQMIFRHGNFGELDAIVAQEHFPGAHGILFDLGFSSLQIEGEGRGFSFQKNESLDMRFDRSDNTRATAAELLSSIGERELVQILEDYGDERWAGRIARHICAKRPLRTTGELVERIAEAIPASARHQRIHFATRTFQALRIAVNGETENIDQGLQAALSCVQSEGKIAVISFHSLEDRLVKYAFRAGQKEECGRIMTKKPMCPTREEITHNPRARSAKLRVFIKK